MLAPMPDDDLRYHAHASPVRPVSSSHFVATTDVFESPLLVQNGSVRSLHKACNVNSSSCRHDGEKLKIKQRAEINHATFFVAADRKRCTEHGKMAQRSVCFRAAPKSDSVLSRFPGWPCLIKLIKHS